MTTAIIIIAVLCIIASAWFAWHTKRVNERKLQKCLDNYEESNELRNTELQGAVHRADEATSALAAMKRSFEETIKEYERMRKDYQKLEKDFAVLKGRPVDAGQPKEDKQPSDPISKTSNKSRGRKPKK